MNLGCVDRLANAPTNCPLMGRFRLATPLSARMTFETPKALATAAPRLA
jgi:hypothetical protein